jgi:hypothetical protein
MLFKGTDAAYYEMCINERNGRKRKQTFFFTLDLIQ